MITMRSQSISDMLYLINIPTVKLAVFQNDRKHVGRNLIEQMAGIFDLGQMSCNHFSYI